MERIISANELKLKGVSAFSKIIEEELEAIISVRGKSSYVILSMEQYNHYRECELETALIETKKELSEKKYSVSSVEEHIAKVLKNG